MNTKITWRRQGGSFPGWISRKKFGRKHSQENCRRRRYLHHPQWNPQLGPGHPDWSPSLLSLSRWEDRPRRHYRWFGCHSDRGINHLCFALAYKHQDRRMRILGGLLTVILGHAGAVFGALYVGTVGVILCYVGGIWLLIWFFRVPGTGE